MQDKKQNKGIDKKKIYLTPGDPMGYHGKERMDIKTKGEKDNIQNKNQKNYNERKKKFHSIFYESWSFL